MTNEEAKDILEYTFLDINNQFNNENRPKHTDIREALFMAVRSLCQLSLPSNLDEAAENYATGLNLGGYVRVINAFKAGAEWMAGQFQKIDGSLDDWYETNGVEYCYGIRANESFEVPEGFYIRKK